MSILKKIEVEEFSSIVETNNKASLFLLTADWSGTGFLAELALDKAQNELSDEVDFYKVEILQLMTNIGQNVFFIDDLPITLFYNHGRLLFRQDGLVNTDKILDLIHCNLEVVK